MEKAVIVYFCMKPKKTILRNDKYIISNIFELFVAHDYFSYRDPAEDFTVPFFSGYP
jgi:hypothetical protein